MLEKTPQDKPSEVEARLFPPQNTADIFKASVELAMSLSVHFDLTPEDIGNLFANLDNFTANDIAYLSGRPDGDVVRAAGEKIKGK